MSRKSKGPRLHLRKRKDRGSYWVILDRGRELGTGCGERDLAEAEKALSDYLAKKHEPRKTSSDIDAILIADVINIYLDEHAPTVKNVEFLTHTAAPIIRWWGKKRLSDIRRSSCMDYVKWRMDLGVGNQTARHDLATLRAAIRYYHAEYGPLQSVPVVSLPGRSPTKKDYWLTRGEVAARLKAARARKSTHHVARLLLIGVYTGTRPGAIMRLRWIPSVDGGWFDLDSETLHRRGSGEGITNKRQPPARIHTRLLPHLRRWREADLAKGLTHVVHFRGKGVQKLRRSWRSVAKAAGHAGDDGPHICRHTAATWQMQAGTDMAEAGGYLGMDPRTLWDVYGHHHPDFQDAAANAQGRR